MRTKALKPHRNNLKSVGRLKHFVKNWKTITHDPWVLKTIMGYKIDFMTEPIQFALPATPNFNATEIKLVDGRSKNFITKRGNSVI